MESEPGSMATPIKLCKVCQEKSDGAHFGVESCRACAAFFRRSVVMRKNYVCRQGQENCLISKSVRCMCRCCRFLKCVKVGMIKEAVQSPRDQLGKRNENDMATVKLEHADSTCAIDPFSFEMGMETLADIFSAEEKHIPLLLRVKAGYLELRERREQYRFTPGLAEPADTNQPFPRKICHKHGHKVLIHDHENIAHLARNYFPKIQELEPEQRRILYRTFFASFVLFDTAYNTYKQSGDLDDKWYISDGNYIDMTDFEYYYMSFQGGGIQPEEAARLFRPSFALFVRNILHPMRYLRITELEFFALILLCFFSHGVEGATVETDEKTLEVRDAVIRELNFYYTRLAFVKEYPVRLAHLMLILPSVHRITTRFREDIEINKLFNTENLDSKLYNLINGIDR